MPRFRPKLRFSLKALLALPIFFVAAWWWYSWPDRTFNQFLVALEEGNSELAGAMLTCEDGEFKFGIDRVECYPPGFQPGSYYQFEPLEFVQRAGRLQPQVRDILLGERAYTIRGVHVLDPDGFMGRRLLFMVARGRVDAAFRRDSSYDEIRAATPVGKRTNEAFWKK